MEVSSLAPVILALAAILTIFTILAIFAIWLRDRLRGESARHPHAFQSQNSRQTLREALAEFHAERGLLAARDVGPEIAAGLRAHDAAHVVFGCDESPRGEVVLTRWSLFGARDAIPLYIRGLRSRETRWLFTDFFRKLRPESLVLGVLDGFSALARSLRMTARWPAGTSGDWEVYLDHPLEEIRREYNIRVV